MYFPRSVNKKLLISIAQPKMLCNRDEKSSCPERSWRIPWYHPFSRQQLRSYGRALSPTLPRFAGIHRLSYGYGGSRVATCAATASLGPITQVTGFNGYL